MNENDALARAQEIHRDHIVRPYVAGAPCVDKFDLAYRRGGRCGSRHPREPVASRVTRATDSG